RYGEVKVADFGLSDAVSNDVVTPEGMVKGKFAYISPESTRDPSLVSNKSDIFSTGIVFWELLANQRLFQRSNDLDTFKAVRACEVPPLHAIRNDISPELDTIVAKSLASDPMQRYASAEEMYDDICRYAAREGISLSRYNLCRVVNELADHSWTGFSGESVSGRMMADLLSELDGMLPPGVAQHLKSFVTRASEAQDVEQNAYVQEDFGDVFDEVGFDQGEVEPGSFADAEATHNIATSALIDQAAASSKAGESSAPRTPAPRTPAPRTPAPKTPAPAVARTPAPSAVPEDVLQQLREQANAHVRSQRMMAIIWGLVGGIVLGAGLGFVLAMAI
ncbi:MAG: protein kinase, partial [Myxococcota bacterium]|nr:protein kinase [Myxococcota bacterium]